MSNAFHVACPLPLDDHATVQMAHGGGGRLMRQLIEGLFLPAFRPHPIWRIVPLLDLRPVRRTTARCSTSTAGRLAFTTDTFVVSPLDFPGGDIGKLAVYGTVNDLAMAGARPLA